MVGFCSDTEPATDPRSGQGFHGQIGHFSARVSSHPLHLAAGQGLVIGISNDSIGANHGKDWNWTTLNHDERFALAKKHEHWQRGLMWTLQNHPRVPEKIRREVSQWRNRKAGAFPGKREPGHDDGRALWQVRV